MYSTCSTSERFRSKTGLSTLLYPLECSRNTNSFVNRYGFIYPCFSEEISIFEVLFSDSVLIAQKYIQVLGLGFKPSVDEGFWFFC